tara:strand:- start:621 stop:1970 length:1350 start_codon:yes stop_codon:yes gene_type:complete
MNSKDTLKHLLKFFSIFSLQKNKVSSYDIKNLLLYLLGFITIFAIYFFIDNQFDSYQKERKKNFNEIASSGGFSNINNFFLEKIRSPYLEQHYIIQNNDSIEKILNNFEIKVDEIKSIVSELKDRNLSNIYTGRKIKLVSKKEQDSKNSVIYMIYPISNTLSVEIRKYNKKFTVTENIIKLTKKEVVVKNEIKTSLYKAAVDSGIEPNIIIEFARIYGFEIDFQRDIRKGDWFEIYYEKFIDDNEKVKDTGKIIYASMSVNNREINLYNFKYKNEIGYYDLKGKSIVKSLMKTPINGARLSSSFGMRKHPILGFNKMHRGTDFAAPSGTPIMASGSGTITRSRWCGGGGNCVKIRHNSTYETIYAHMKSFAKGIKEGKKVRQGQIIGYVGSTGMSTGPHLHYEVVVNGKKVNSQKLKLPSGKVLKGDERKEFEIKRIKIDLKLSEIRNY